MNIKKLFAILAGVSMVANVSLPGLVHAATPDNEYGRAYEWARSQSITTKDTYEAANMGNEITRAEFAKMASNWAMKLLGKKANEDATCVFSDIDSVQGDLHDFVLTSCKLGLMGQLSNGNTEFRPHALITRGEIGTVLSRALWGKAYEGGQPYFADHLKQLQKAGIMKKIDNPYDNAKRGDVMLMLHRTSESDVINQADELIACLEKCKADDTECVAACAEEEEDNNDKEDEVVKAGSLVVSSSAADDRKVVVSSGTNAVSDLDTLTFSTSEEVTLTKVVLEKYGYSKASNLVKSVWLEDEDGKEVSKKARPNDKGLVNLTIDKDYKVVDGKLNATIVVETNSGAEVGGTLGFKVHDVISTAKDVDLGDYKAYTYDVVAYDGTEATIIAKGGSKDYNYEGEVVEISKFKIQAPDDSAIVVNSFTLTNAGKLDIYDNIDVEDVEVVIDGKKVKANIDINKDEEMTVSLKEPLEIASKAKSEVVINAALNDEFEDFGESIKLEIASASDLSATDKNNARITVAYATNYVEYFFKGGKIRITNTKLGSVEASINSTDILIASGYISVGQDVENGVLKVTVTGSGEAIEAMRLQIAGDEYDGDPDGTFKTWTFDHVELSESGKIRLYVDTVNDVNYKEEVLKFAIAGWDSLEYVDASKGNEKAEVAGALTISNLTLIPAEGTLTNNLKSSDDVEFTNGELNTEIVLDGTYTADKQDIRLNSFTVSRNAGYTGNSEIKFYLYIDDMETSVADFVLATGAANVSGSDTFTDVLVKAGKSVKVRVEAEVDANDTLTTDNKYTIGKFKVALDGEDENDNDAGHAEKNTSNMVIVNQGSVSVSDSPVAKKGVLRKASSATIAEFTVKPDGSSSVALESVEFDLNFSPAYDGTVKLYVNGSNKKFNGSKTNGNGAYKAEFNTTVNSEGAAVKVELEDEYEGEVSLTNLKVNGNEIKNQDYNKKFTEAVVWFTEQSYNDDQTTFKFNIDKKESVSIENVQIRLDGDAADAWRPLNDNEAIKAGVPYLINNVSGSVKDVVEIRFTVDGGGAKAAVYECFDETDSVATAAGDSSTCTSQCESGHTCTWQVKTPEVAATYINYASNKYLDMFKLGAKEDGSRVQVGRLKNS